MMSTHVTNVSFYHKINILTFVVYWTIFEDIWEEWYDQTQLSLNKLNHSYLNLVELT